MEDQSIQTWSRGRFSLVRSSTGPLSLLSQGKAPAFKVGAGQPRGPPREEVELGLGKVEHCSRVRLTRSAVEVQSSKDQVVR